MNIVLSVTLYIVHCKIRFTNHSAKTATIQLKQQQLFGWSKVVRLTPSVKYNNKIQRGVEPIFDSLGPNGPAIQ